MLASEQRGSPHRAGLNQVLLALIEAGLLLNITVLAQPNSDLATMSVILEEEPTKSTNTRAWSWVSSHVSKPQITTDFPLNITSVHESR